MLRDEGNVLLAAGLDKIVKEESKTNSKLDQVRKALNGSMIWMHSDSDDDISKPVSD